MIQFLLEKHPNINKIEDNLKKTAKLYIETHKYSRDMENQERPPSYRKLSEYFGVNDRTLKRAVKRLCWNQPLRKIGGQRAMSDGEEDELFNNSGSSYLFKIENDHTATEIAKVKALDANVDDNFGVSSYETILV